MPNSKAQQGRIVLARDTIRKVRPRSRVVCAVRELVGMDIDLSSFRDDYINRYTADSLGVTLEDAVDIRGIRGAGAQDNGVPKRNAKQEAACRAADTAWCGVKRAAGIASNPKKSHARKRSLSPTSSGAGPSVAIPERLFRELIMCGPKPMDNGGEGDPAQPFSWPCTKGQRG